MTAPAFTYGKHAGKPIRDFSASDLNYLYWVRNNPEHWAKQSKTMKDAINLRLDGKV